MIRSRFLLTSLVLAAFSTFVSAATVPMGYANYGETRSAGSFAPDSNSLDGDGSLKMQTFDNTSNGKVSVAFGTGAPLGTLGDLSALSVQYFKSSVPALNNGNTAVSQFAYRILTNAGGTQALIWENQYNGNGIVPTDSWQQLSLETGNFWQRTNGTNYNGGSQAHPLSYYTAGNTEAPAAFALSPLTPIYGIEVAYGSGVGAFTGYVDNVNATFTGVTYNGNVSVPEPASLALFGLGGLTLLRRRR